MQLLIMSLQITARDVITDGNSPTLAAFTFFVMCRKLFFGLPFVSKFVCTAATADLTGGFGRLSHRQVRLYT